MHSMLQKEFVTLLCCLQHFTTYDVRQATIMSKNKKEWIMSLVSFSDNFAQISLYQNNLL